MFTIQKNKSIRDKFDKLSFMVLGGKTPISVIIPPVIKCSGVMSKAGFQQFTPKK